MAVAVILAINIHQMKTHFLYQQTARDVFTASNVPVEDYMKGINFSKPVVIRPIHKSDMFIQYQIPGAPQGNFYGFLDAKPDELGVSDTGYDPEKKMEIRKEARIYVTLKDTNVLMSYAQPIQDYWSTEKNEERVGGAVQIFTVCKEECFRREF